MTFVRFGSPRAPNRATEDSRDGRMSCPYSHARIREPERESPRTQGERDVFEFNYELRAGYLLSNEMRVLGFHGRERISDTYEFAVDIATEVDLVTLQYAVLGHGAFLRWSIGDHEPRSVFGVIHSVEAISQEQLGTGTSGAPVPGDAPWPKPTPTAEWLARPRLFKLTLAPRLALLRLRRNSRVFQKKTVREIVDQILRKHGVTATWSPAIRLEPRAYCVQYNENDFEFVSRLLAEEGIFYHFAHPSVEAATVERAAQNASAKLQAIAAGDTDATTSFLPAGALGAETVIFGSECDYPFVGTSGLAAGSAGQSPPTLSYLNVGAAGHYVDEETIHQFGWKRALTSQSVTFSDTQLVDTVAVAAATPASADDRRAAQDGLATMARALSPSQRGSSGAGSTTRTALQMLAASAPVISRTVAEVYEHAEHWESANAGTVALRSLQMLRRERVLGSGRSRIKRLAPGYQFALDHPIAEVNGNYVLTAVTHVAKTHVAGTETSAGVHEGYSNEFECVPASMVLRPDRKDFSPQQILESATVVGVGDLESGDEAQAGCVKIRFHWDRSQNAADVANACWVPVMQPWAGGSFGFQFIPRVGMEVLVSFLSGSESLPVILGARHHQVAPPPFGLPQNLTQSGIRTRSLAMATVPETADATLVRSERFNQLQFEDAYGAEYAEVRSSRDVRLAAGHDVNADAADTIRLHSDTLSVVTDSDQRHQVGGNKHETVVGADLQTVNGDRSQSVRGNRLEHVKGTSTQFIGGDLDLNVLGNAIETITGNRETVILGGFNQRSAGPHALHADGGIKVSTSDALTLEAPHGVVIRCGQSSIALHRDEIVMTTPKFRMLAKQEVSIRGKQASLEFGEGTATLTTSKSVEVFSKAMKLFADNASADLSNDGVTLSASKDVIVNGNSVALNAKGSGVVLDSNATVQGGSIALKSGGSATSRSKERTGTAKDARDVYVLATQILAPGGQPLALEFVNVIDPDTDDVVVGPIQTTEKGEIRVEVPENKSYAIQIVPAHVESRRIPTDHETTWMVNATFVTHRGEPVEGLKVTVHGAQTLHAVTSATGRINVCAPPGPYALEVDGKTFQAHAVQLSQRTREGCDGFVFVLEPEPPNLPEDARRYRSAQGDTVSPAHEDA